jgi:streptogramin lyase
VDNQDNAWGAREGDKPGLFRVDSKTGDINLYPVPDMKFVRGIEVDAQQNVWFGDVTNHRLGKFDPKTEKITYYKAPTENLGIYGIVIDKRSGDLWIGDYLGANLDQFNPNTGKFTEYPFPSRTQMIRFFALIPKAESGSLTFANGRIGVLETDDTKSRLTDNA